MIRTSLSSSVAFNLACAIALGSLAACGGSEPKPATPPPPSLAEPAPAPPPTSAAITPAPAKAEPGDPLEVGPTIYKKVFENAVVRILEVGFKPGDKIALHKHPDHVIYVVAGGKLSIKPAEGAAQDMDLKPGQAVFMSAQAHSAENTGTTEVKLAVFEVRGKGAFAAPKGADPNVVAKKVYKQLLENEQVRVFEATFAKGTKLPAHAHPEHAAYVITAGKLKLTDPGKPKAEQVKELDLAAGFAGFLPAQVHAAENVGPGELKLVVVEMKPEAGAAPPPDGKDPKGTTPPKKDDAKKDDGKKKPESPPAKP